MARIDSRVENRDPHTAAGQPGGHWAGRCPTDAAGYVRYLPRLDFEVPFEQPNGRSQSALSNLFEVLDSEPALGRIGRAQGVESQIEKMRGPLANGP